MENIDFCPIFDTVCLTDSRTKMYKAQKRPCEIRLLQHLTGSFLRFIFVRIQRIELWSRPWQGRILPLNHTRNENHYTENPRGFQCAPGRSRTCNPLFRRQVLYPLSHGCIYNAEYSISNDEFKACCSPTIVRRSAIPPPTSSRTHPLYKGFFLNTPCRSLGL